MNATATPPSNKPNITAPEQTQQPPKRHVKSYVHRGSRSPITPSQQKALLELAPKWCIAYKPQPFDFNRAFGRQAPLILEIGFGMGETTEKIALAQPENNFLGVEVYNSGVGAMLRRIEQSGLENIRIIQHDAVEVVRAMIAPNTLAGVHVFFPDPWPKKRHHKRRLIQAEFTQLLASRIAPGGYLHCATDWEHYAEQMLEILSAEPLLENTVSGFAPTPDYRPQTKFEKRGLALGHGVWDLIFKRK